MCVCVYLWPLTEEISLKIFGCRGLTIVSLDLLSDRDSVYTREPRMKIWGLPWKRVWYVRGLPCKLAGNFCSRKIAGPFSPVRGMGWLRLVGSFKLQVSFAEYCLFHRALWQKRPVSLRSLVIAGTPHMRSALLLKQRGLLPMERGRRMTGIPNCANLFLHRFQWAVVYAERQSMPA